MNQLIRLGLIAGMALTPMLARAQTLISPGRITWGLAATFPPFEFEKDGKPVGFDLDLAAALAKDMKLKSEISTFQFSGLIPALLGKRIDAIISGMYVNAKREQVADFVPYMLVGNQIVVPHGNPLHMTGPLSLCGHRVAAPIGTVFETAAQAADKACTAAGKPAISLLTLAGTTTCALALAENRADAIIVSTPTAAALLNSNPGAYATGGGSFDTHTQVGIAVAKDNPGLKAALERAMKTVVTDGTYARLLKKWSMPAGSSLVKVADVK